MAHSLVPTGTCWCGCGGETGAEAFFLPGHDRKAESALIRIEYGGIPQFLVDHDYGPGGKNLSLESEQRQRGGDAAK